MKNIESEGVGAMELGAPVTIPQNQAETFGATLVRELVAAAQEMHKPKATLSELVFSAKLARDSGMTTVAEQIEAQIGALTGAGPVATISAPPVPALAPHQNGHSNGATS